MKPEDVIVAVRSAPTAHEVIAVVERWNDPAGHIAWPALLDPAVADRAFAVGVALNSDRNAGVRYLAALALVASPAIALWRLHAGLALATVAALVLVTLAHRAARAERLARVVAHVALNTITRLEAEAKKESTKS